MPKRGLRERRVNFATPRAEELSKRCVSDWGSQIGQNASAGASTRGGSEGCEGCCQVIVDLLFSDFTAVVIIFLVYLTLYAVYHFHGR